MQAKALGATTAKINAEKVQAKAAVEKKDKPATFHQKELVRKNTMTDEKMKAAETAGHCKATGFFGKLHEPAHPEHSAVLSEFKNKYGGSEAKARAGLMADAMREYDCHPIENRDTSFEAKTLEQNRPKLNASKTDLAHYDILKDSLIAEWAARGYSGTDDVIKNWKAKYK